MLRRPIDTRKEDPLADRREEIGDAGRGGTRFRCPCCPGGVGALPGGLAGALRSLARNQGEAGDDAEALLVLAFLGAGYTHLSDGGEVPDPNDSSRRINFGEVVKRGVHRLRADPAGHAAPRTLRAQALVVVALAREIEMTRLPVLVTPWRQALDRLVDGIAARRQELRNSSTVGWCALALAHETEPEIAPAREALLAASGEDAGGVLARVLLGGRIDGSLDRVLAELARPTAGNAEDFEALYFMTLAIERIEGPARGRPGRRWVQWNDHVRRLSDATKDTEAGPTVTALRALVTEAACRCPDALAIGGIVSERE